MNDNVRVESVDVEKPSPAQGDYTVLFVVMGVGIIVLLIAFISTVNIQSRGEKDRFDAYVADRHRETIRFFRNEKDNFENIAKTLNTTKAINRTAISAYLNKSAFSCVMLMNVNLQKEIIINRDILKSSKSCEGYNFENFWTDIAQNFAAKVFSEARWMNDASVQIYIATQVRGSGQYLVAVLPFMADLPDIQNSPIGVKLLKVSNYKLSSSRATLADWNMPFRIIQETFYDEVLVLKYYARDALFSPSLKWPFAVLSLGLVIVSLLAFIVYHLIHQNTRIKIEVEKKTRELGQMTLQAVRANETKSRFLASVSHEIRTPLNLILGMAELLAETPINQEQKQYVKTFSRAGQHLLDLINDILDLAMIESGEVTLNESYVDVINLVESVSDIVAPACRVKNINYSHDIGVEIPRMIKTDGKRLRQILINLLNNALKFTERGEILLRVTFIEISGSPVINFEVSDTGPGIPAGHQQRIFEAFYQVDEVSKRQKGGVGLGLALVKTYVSLLGGVIHVESELEKGSRFFVSLPLKQKPEDKWLDEIKNQLPDGIKQRILILTLNISEGYFIEAALHYLGFDAVRAKSGREAIKALTASGDNFHRCVVDLRADGESDFDFLSEYKKLGFPNDKLIILMPLVPSNTNKKQIQSFGASKICFTPVKIKSLVRCIQSTEIFPLEPSTIETRSKTPVFKSGTRILIAEDDVDNKFLIQSYLANQNIEVAFLENGQEALELYKNSKGAFNMIITDIQMPKMDGLELIKRVRKFEGETQLPNVPIVVLTADALDKQHEEVLKAGANHYLTKPIGKVNLIQTIHQFAYQVEPRHINI